jgi:serine/threonine protein kinase
MQEPSQQNIISAGQFAVVHKLNEKVVRKVPCCKSDPYSLHALKIEAQIYRHLGQNKRIARWFQSTDDHIDLQYEANGDLETYLRTHAVNNEVRYRIARQAIEAVDFIHKNEVIHSDLSARQFLVDERLNIRLSDFGGSSLRGSEAIVMENATHFLPRDENLPNTVQSDIFALGSTLYEIILGHRPYEGKEDDEVRHLYSQELFPSVESIGDATWRLAIQKCWKSHYQSTREILEDVSAISSPSSFFV